MNKEQTIEVFEVLYEAFASLEDLSDEELVEHRKDVLGHIEEAMQMLGAHFTDEERLEQTGN